MMGASKMAPPLSTRAVYIGILHVPVNSAWPVYGVVGKSMCVACAEPPAAFVVPPTVVIEGTITLVNANDVA
jgi:hypothetical protein